MRLIGEVGSRGNKYVLKDKMNCGVVLENCFCEFPSVPWQWQYGTSQQGLHTVGTLRKEFTKPTPQFILSLCMRVILSLLASFGGERCGRPRHLALLVSLHEGERPADGRHRRHAAALRDAAEGPARRRSQSTKLGS